MTPPSGTLLANQTNKSHLEGPRCLLSAWKKIFTYNFFSLTTFVSKKFQIYYYKNGEMPDLSVRLVNKVPEGGVTGENFVNKFHSEFY